MSISIPQFLFTKFTSRLEVSLFMMMRVCIMICVIGILLNVLAKQLNGGKMPVHDLSEPGMAIMLDDQHSFSYDPVLLFIGDWIPIETKSTDNLFVSYLARIISFPIGKSILASPGDVLMWISSTLGMFLSLSLIIILTQNATIKKLPD